MPAIRLKSSTSVPWLASLLAIDLFVLIFAVLTLFDNDGPAWFPVFFSLLALLALALAIRNIYLLARTFQAKTER